MIKVNTIGSFEEFLQLWPRLVALARDEQVTCRNTEDLLRLFLQSIEYGAVFVIRNDYGVVGSACVEVFDDHLVLYSLPSDNGEQLGKKCLACIEAWAVERKLKYIDVTNSRFCGSSFRYFEKTLGFHRKSITYRKELTK